MSEHTDDDLIEHQMRAVIEAFNKTATPRYPRRLDRTTYRRGASITRFIQRMWGAMKGGSGADRTRRH